ncbi:MAG: GNAT family N-acetyltransferase [Simplicispira sp.]|nr:GNAT family N-acetyltransferase [Simplicispira sp.]
MKFIFSRVARISGDLVFEKILTTDSVEAQQQINPVYQVFLIDATNIKNPENQSLVDSILQGENLQYLEGLQKKDCMVAITKNRKLVHTSFIQFETSYKKLLNETDSTPLIGNCWTSPDERGQGLYPYAIARCCKEMARRGYQRVLISCAPDNTPSVAGIHKAGFLKIREVKTLLILTKIYFQKINSQKKPVVKYKAGII